MAYKIAIVSGKGGTGKTTLSVNLFHYLSLDTTRNVVLADCDVEEPNDLIFLSEAEKIRELEVFQSIPQINTKSCTFCQRCVEYCEFNAITMLPSMTYATVNNSLCHSCGACLEACNENAITEHNFSIGKISEYKVSKNSTLIEGRLKVGSAMQTLLIKRVKQHIDDNKEIIIFDAPPGTSCSVVESISNANMVIVVTEPTPFGLHDLKLMVELLNEMKIPFGVVINKSGIGNNDAYTYLLSEQITILGEIPFMKSYASNYASGDLFQQIPSNIEKSLVNIATQIKNKLISHEGNHNTKW